jgi:radical SAM superfamily enzyme YgiQ (UPF0313 family)
VTVVSHEQVDLVGISSMTWCSDEAISGARAIKQACPSVRLVAGGAGPTAFPEYFEPHFDYVVVGEGEVTMLGIVRGELGRGIIRAERNTVWNGLPLPVHPRSLVDGHKLHMRGTWPMARSEQLPVSLSGSRGCPNACSFCLSEAMWGRRVIKRSPGDVAIEIEILVGLGYNSFDFTDLNLNLDAGWLIGLCDAIRERGLNKKAIFGGLWNPAITKRMDEVIPACAAAGFVMLSIGVESPNQMGRARLNKQKSDTDATFRVFEMMADVGITTRMLFIVGSPGQTETDIEEMVDFATASRTSELRISIHTPFPGTRDWADAEIQRRITTRDWALYDTAHQVMRSELGDVAGARLHVLSSFYNSARYRENRAALIAKNPAFEVGYRQLEGGFLVANNLIEPANRLV